MGWELVANSEGVYAIYDEDENPEQLIEALQKYGCVIAVPRASHVEASNPFEGFYVDLSPCGGPERLVNTETGGIYFKTRKEALYAEKEWLQSHLYDGEVLQKLSEQACPTD